MTPKEKAQELIDKMYDVDKSSGSILFYEAKQCALIAVDEILNEFDHSALNDEDYEAYKMKYWQEVKQEIEKL